MFYKVLRFLTHFLLRVYYRKIYINGTAFIDPNKPAILASNHPNTFMDAIMLAILLDEPLYFLTRSDMFKAPVARYVLGLMHLIPIYRLKEGTENLHKNKETFTFCYDILKKNGKILIFSEGASIQERKLRPLKKGTARLAFGAAFDPLLDIKDLQVIPVGLNYTNPTRFRKELLVEIEKPIPVDSFQNSYLQNPAKAFIQFNETLKTGMEQCLVLFENAENNSRKEELAETLFEIDRNNDPSFYNLVWKDRDSNRFIREKALAANIEALSILFVAKYELLHTQSKHYYQLLKTYGLSDNDVKETGHIHWKIAIVILGFVLFLLGYALNIFPVWLANRIATGKIKKKEYFSAVRMSAGFFIYLVYYPLLVILAMIYNIELGITLAIAMPLWGYFALFYMEWYREVKGYLHLQKQFRMYPTAIIEIRNLRVELTEVINKLAKSKKAFTYTP